ncbi:ABC-type multidrug/protein/lipid transport system, ATPase component [Gloeomargarita lithophora Alchichica-D10]|uniref:ABC-type multidrug/protein/lipid transport system, ATPase component n=1 Tax=Gloeomargarita lithophora Alchichica-D10 TaxID=1188229 RepID=A0A1J0AFQ2_9CYAN|nr:ABC transporter ATP-binding protein [Gloeomargarita lithophora]APB34744.1 ABC-type multidrug/protein/lipid transport system, ATPase component [Gloeomargarita lithophora Alchichica-D10]
MNYWRNRIKQRVKQPAYRLVLSVINKYRLRLLFTFLLSTGVAFLEGSTYVLIYFALSVLGDAQIRLPLVGDWLNNQPKLEIVAVLVGVALAFQVLQSALKYASNLVSSYLGTRIGIYLMQKQFGRVLGFSYPCVSRYRYGELLDYINSGGTVSMLIQTWNRLILSMLLALAYLTVLVWISPILLFATLVVSVGLVLIQRQVIPKIEKISRQLANDSVQAGSFVVESVQALRLVYSFHRQRQILEQLHRLQLDLLKLNDRQTAWNALPQPLSQVLVTSVLGVMLLTSLWVLSQDRPLNLILPALATFISAYNRFANQGQLVANTFTGLAAAFGNITRLNEFLSNEDKEFLRTEGTAFTGVARDIRFEGVTLHYPNTAAPAVIDLSFTLPAGQVTALVGASGAGKSSVADLLIALYEPSQGRILVDGIDRRELALPDWWHQLGVVSQDNFVFNATIYENIRFGRLTATDAEVEQAAQAAYASEFIERLPQQYETLVGERGYRLSGGQRQRLALARAILRQPSILILDEATSALDSESEALVQKALYEFQQNRTVLVIAHRLSTIRNADQILVMEQGRLVEQGSHGELLRQAGRYANYWHLQVAGQSPVPLG